MGYETLIGELGKVFPAVKNSVYSLPELYTGNRILFMDEATSSLDTESERFVNAAIKNEYHSRLLHTEKLRWELLTGLFLFKIHWCNFVRSFVYGEVKKDIK